MARCKVGRTRSCRWHAVATQSPAHGHAASPWPARPHHGQRCQQNQARARHQKQLPHRGFQKISGAFNMVITGVNGSLIVFMPGKGKGFRTDKTWVCWCRKQSGRCGTECCVAASSNVKVTLVTLPPPAWAMIKVSDLSVTPAAHQCPRLGSGDIGQGDRGLDDHLRPRCSH